MAFLGLGSFGTGLVTGLAESANTALQDSMDRIRRRIDNVSEYRVKKAISEQEQRASEVREVEDLINQGSKLFQDNPRASEYAATLLDKYGIDGYKALLPKMQEAQFNNGLNISDYFTISEVSDITKNGVKPLTVNDYAESYIGGNFKVPDYKLPPDVVPNSGLVGAIFGDIDISGRIQRQYESDVTAAGYDMDIEVPDVTLGDITFNKFKFDVDVAPTFDDKVNLYRQALLDENKSETEIMQLQSDFSNLLSVAENSRSYDTQIKALNMQLDRTTPGSEASQEIVFKINNIKTTRDLEIAEAQNDEESIFNLKAKSAWTKYKQNPTAENLRAFKNIRNQQNEFLTGRGVSLTQQAEEIKIAMQGLNPNSDEYATLEESLKNIRLINEAGIEVSTGEYDSAQRLINTNAELLGMGNPILTDKEYIEAKKLLDSGNYTIKQLQQQFPSAYSAYEKAYVLLTNNRKQAWQELINQAPNDRGLIAYGNAKGYITQPSTTVTPTDDITATVPVDTADITTSTTDTAVSTLDEQTQNAIPTIDEQTQNAIPPERVDTTDYSIVVKGIEDKIENLEPSSPSYNMDKSNLMAELNNQKLKELGYSTTQNIKNNPAGYISALIKINPRIVESTDGLNQIVKDFYDVGVDLGLVSNLLKPYREAIEEKDSLPVQDDMFSDASA